MAVLIAIAPGVAVRGAELLAAGGAVLAIVMLWLALVAESVVAPQGRAPIPSAELKSVTLLNAAQGMMVLGSVWGAMLCGKAHAGTGSQVAGALLMIAGAGLRVSSIATLGECFADGFQPLAASPIVRGPYRYLRHPAEVGLWLLTAGFVTVVSAWSGAMVPGMLVLVACSAARMAAESRAMAHGFGARTEGASGFRPTSA